MTDPYLDREQTRAKHFILKSYLQALAFKVLTFSDITYIDGFSGPWQSKTENFSDSSFMIAISVLMDAQKQIAARGDGRRRIKCFFSENDPGAYVQLESAVAEYHQPRDGFEIKTYEGKFEDAVSEIQSFIGTSFPLIFIDPTGWRGYPFDKIKPLFARPKCEVLINFMYDFINRFVYSDEPDIVEFNEPDTWWARLANSARYKSPAGARRGKTISRNSQGNWSLWVCCIHEDRQGNVGASSLLYCLRNKERGWLKDVPANGIRRITEARQESRYCDREKARTPN